MKIFKVVFATKIIASDAFRRNEMLQKLIKLGTLECEVDSNVLALIQRTVRKVVDPTPLKSLQIDDNNVFF